MPDTKLPVKVSTDIYRKTVCRYCQCRLPLTFLDLGKMPLANAFLKEDRQNDDEFVCPLSLCWCANCSLVQLSHVVPPNLMFENYLYVSSTTQTFQKHFADYAKMVKDKLRHVENGLAVDIGSNDGLLLECYEREGLRAVGIEPAGNLSELANRSGRKTINQYFNSASVREILERYGPAHVVSGNNVFAHIDDAQEVCKNVLRLLVDEGIFVLEFPYWVTMAEELFFDMIYHEHLSYISVHALCYLFRRFDLSIFDIDYVPSHGGSLRVFAQKKRGPYTVSGRVEAFLDKEKKQGCLSFDSYKRFSDRVHKAKKEILECVHGMKALGKTISGYGAPAKANTLLCFCGLTDSDINFIVDDNPLKQGYLTPGTKIPVVASTHLSANPTDCVMIFAWNFAQEIVEKLKFLKQRGVRFIIPLPSPKLI